MPKYTRRNGSWKQNWKRPSRIGYWEGIGSWNRPPPRETHTYKGGFYASEDDLNLTKDSRGKSVDFWAARLASLSTQTNRARIGLDTAQKEAALKESFIQQSKQNGVSSGTATTSDTEAKSSAPNLSEESKKISTPPKLNMRDWLLNQESPLLSPISGCESDDEKIVHFSKS